MDQSKKIVVIDDNENDILLIQVILQKSHPEYKIITAQSGPEGIEIIKNEKPDII